MKPLPIKTMLNANASFQDLKGQAALAWHIDEYTALEVVAKTANINTDLYDAIGLSLFMGLDGFSMSVYIANKQQATNGKRQVRSVMIDLKRKEFFSMVKDLSITLFDPHTNHDQEYEYTGEDSLENFIVDED